MHLLSRTEEFIMLAVWRLQDNAYGITIRQHLQEVAGLDYSVGGIYVPLDRLAGRGYLSVRRGDPTPQRGGMSKRFYRLTAKGAAALHDVRRLHTVMWKDLPALSIPT